MYPDDKQIEKWWDELEDIPFNETMNGKLLLSTDWLNFKVGTEREDIWHWFDAVHSKGVYYLLTETKKYCYHAMMKETDIIHCSMDSLLNMKALK